MANLQDLADEIRSLAASIEQQTSDFAVHIAYESIVYLAFNTRVDTSQALSSWIVTFDEPATERNLPHFPGVGGSTLAESGAQTVEDASNKLAEKIPGHPIFISNNWGYVARLNEEDHYEDAVMVLANSLLADFKLKV